MSCEPRHQDKKNFLVMRLATDKKRQLGKIRTCLVEFGDPSDLSFSECSEINYHERLVMSTNHLKVRRDTTR
jgi:hypothetical protein